MSINTPWYILGSKNWKSLCLTLSLPRVIKFKFPLQPHQKYITLHSMKNIAFRRQRWKMILLPYFTFLTGEWKGQWFCGLTGPIWRWKRGQSFSCDCRCKPMEWRQACKLWWLKHNTTIIHASPTSLLTTLFKIWKHGNYCIKFMGLGNSRGGWIIVLELITIFIKVHEWTIFNLRSLKLICTGIRSCHFFVQYLNSIFYKEE